MLQSGPSTETISTTPPENTIAIVVDIGSTGGAFKIHKLSDNNWGNVFVDGIGSGDDVENTTKLLIIPWETGWLYRSIGAVGVRYVVKK
jgi:hypothetical protein